MLVPVAPVGQLVAGMRRVVTVGDRRILVLVEDDGPHAVLDACPHHGASLRDGRWSRATIECPWHGWVFDVRTGKCLHGPSRAATFPVVAVDGIWQVSLPDEQSRPDEPDLPSRASRSDEAAATGRP